MPELQLLDYLPSVPDFPQPGIVFRDICPLLADAAAFAHAIGLMAERVHGWTFDHVVGIESRGLIFATALATRMRLGLVLVRKPGKLPPPTMREAYDLEYGQDALEIQRGRLPPSASVLLVDDVIATGGTLRAAARLAEKCGARVQGAVALLSLEKLGGADALRRTGLRVTSALQA
jgi:adenine phosphoribosyltransferase